MRSHNSRSNFMKMSVFLATIFMMVMLSSAEDCPSGWTCTDDHCYCVFDRSVKQPGAKELCENINATLPMPKTKDLEASFVSILGDILNGKIIWIGLEKGDDGKMLWADGEEFDFSYANWLRSGSETVHRCNGMFIGDGRSAWGDAGCDNAPATAVACEKPSTALIPICEQPNAVVVDNQCISLETEPETWEQAKAACEAKGPSVTLTSLLSPVVREYIQEQTKTLAKRVWLGGTDDANENTWVWTATGEVADIDPTWWGKGQPDNWNGNEDCLLIRPDGKLNDANCNWKFPYFCSSRIS